MRKFEEKIEVDAPASAIFSIYQDVENWKQWDRGVTFSRVDNFASGGRGVLKPSKGPRVKLRIAEVTKDTSFASEYRLPLCHMRMDYLLTPVADNKTMVTHRVTFDGLLSSFFGRLFSGEIRKGLPDGLSKLKGIAEVEHRDD